MAVITYFSLFYNYLLIAGHVAFNYAAEAPRQCKTSGILGVCTIVTKCDIALTALSQGQPHHLKRCGFEDDDEIVCCPLTSIVVKGPDTSGEPSTHSTDSRLNTKRKCDKACEEISTGALSQAVTHIIGGNNSQENEFPHMAALGYPFENIEWNCGGSIISKTHILTAAHCFTKRVKPTKVRVGITRLDDPNPQDFDIKQIHVHEKYNITNRHNDIALVEIDGEIKFSEKAYPACLYSNDDDPKNLIITGWGQTMIGAEDNRSNHLQKAFVAPYDVKECNDLYLSRSFGSKDIANTQFCAHTPPGQNASDACWGDSGGPCQIKNNKGLYSIVSIISYGQQCASKIPGVYTRVSAYLDWIEQYAWSNNI